MIKTGFAFIVVLLVGCGADNGVGAVCAKSNAHTPGEPVTCASGLNCCLGLPDTGGTCQAPEVDNPCPAGGHPN